MNQSNSSSVRHHQQSICISEWLNGPAQKREFFKTNEMLLKRIQVRFKRKRTTVKGGLAVLVDKRWIITVLLLGSCLLL